LKKKFREIIVRLLKLNNAPQEIALGAAIGVFISILPLYGLHTLLVIILAVLVKPANKIAMFLGTNFSLPPTLPFITWAAYEIGRAVLKGRFDPITFETFKNITWQKIVSHYQPLFIGSLILGTICAVLAYIITYYLVKRFKDKRAAAQ